MKKYLITILSLFYLFFGYSQTDTTNVDSTMAPLMEMPMAMEAMEEGEEIPYIPQVIPPSPTASSLGQYGDVPVSNYTGVPSISIPVYSVKSGEIELPITLSYHGSGIKVAKEAGWVGLAWELNAGFAINNSLQVWYPGFIAIARIALEDKPQLLEMLGVVKKGS